MTEKYQKGDIVDVMFPHDGSWHRAVVKSCNNHPSPDLREWGVMIVSTLLNYVASDNEVRPARPDNDEPYTTVQLGTLKPGDWFKLGPRTDHTWCVLELTACGLNDVGVGHLDALERDGTVFVCREESNELRAEPSDRDVYPIVVQEIDAHEFFGVPKTPDAGKVLDHYVKTGQTHEIVDESHHLEVDMLTEMAVEKWGKEALTSFGGPQKSMLIWNEIVDENNDTWKPVFDDRFQLCGYKRHVS